MNSENKYILLCFFLSFKFKVFTAFVKVVILRSSFIISHNQRSRVLLEWVPFINASLGAVVLITLAWLGHVEWKSATLSFWHAFPPSLVVLYQVITWLPHVTCRNGSASFWFALPPRLVIVAVVIIAPWRFWFVTWSHDQKSCHW